VPREQRRLAAIVAADVVGYSRLMGRDESATLAALNAHRRELVDPLVIEHGGRIVKSTGDGVLLEFSSVVDAVRCAVAVQNGMAARNAGMADDDRVRFRIGINVGDVIVEGDDIFGDGVNVAARLEQLAEAGGICISDRAWRDVRGRLDAGFVDGGEQALKNIAEPVRVWRWSGASSPATSALPSIDLALPDKPSIAVLPFANMSGDPEQEYFTDGVTEDIITELSRFHELFVIARNSSFTYKGRAIDVRVVAKELGVRYVLEGSIRKAANRIRVTGQLIDALSGNHIWADRYDRVLEDVFAVQEDLTQSIVRAIAPHIRDAETAKARRRPDSLSAYEIAVRANAKGWEAYIKSDPALREEAIGDARAALAIDATSTLALYTLALVQWQHVLLRSADRDREAAWQEGMMAATRWIELDRADSLGHTWRGVFLAFDSDPARLDEALACVRRGHDLNPHDSFSLLALGFVEINVGDPESAIGHLQQSLRVSPRDPLAYMMHDQLSRASLAARQYGNGVGYAQLAIGEAPRLTLGYTRLAVNYVGLGEIERAKAAMGQVRREWPEYFEKAVTDSKGAAAYGRGSYRNPEHRRRWQVFFLIAAGVADPGEADRYR